MRRIFISLFLISGIVFQVNAIPLRFTKHLTEVSPADCERVLAKIATTKSKIRDLKNFLDEVPQCVVFFTEKLTTESFRDKDYRRGCEHLLQNFCQQNRYLSLSTSTENYGTNNLKLAGTMGLGFMFGRTGVHEAKRAIDKFKKGDDSKAKATQSKGDARLEDNIQKGKTCDSRGPEECILSWKLKNEDCLDKEKVYNDKELICECIPDDTNETDWNIIKVDGKFSHCENKAEAECLDKNKNKNKSNNILEWAYNTVDGCHVKQCLKDFDINEDKTGCEKGNSKKCEDNNTLSDTALIKWPSALSGKTKQNLHIASFGYRAGGSKGWQGCYITSCVDDWEVDDFGRQCKEIEKNVVIVVKDETEDDTSEGDCSDLNALNGEGIKVTGNIFGSEINDECRLVCEEGSIKNDTKCEKLSTNGTGICDKTFSFCEEIYKASMYGWEYNLDKSKCEPLCKGTKTLNPAHTSITNVCIDKKQTKQETDETEEETAMEKCKTALENYLEDFKSVQYKTDSCEEDAKIDISNICKTSKIKEVKCSEVKRRQHRISVYFDEAKEIYLTVKVQDVTNGNNDKNRWKILPPRHKLKGFNNLSCVKKIEKYKDIFENVRYLHVDTFRKDLANICNINSNEIVIEFDNASYYGVKKTYKISISNENTLITIKFTPTKYQDKNRNYLRLN